MKIQSAIHGKKAILSLLFCAAIAPLTFAQTTNQYDCSDSNSTIVTDLAVPANSGDITVEVRGPNGFGSNNTARNGGGGHSITATFAYNQAAGPIHISIGVAGTFVTYGTAYVIAGEGGSGPSGQPASGIGAVASGETAGSGVHGTGGSGLGNTNSAGGLDGGDGFAAPGGAGGNDGVVTGYRGGSGFGGGGGGGCGQYGANGMGGLGSLSDSGGGGGSGVSGQTSYTDGVASHVSGNAWGGVYISIAPGNQSPPKKPLSCTVTGKPVIQAQ